jgi:hypothetical protein
MRPVVWAAILLSLLLAVDGARLTRFRDRDRGGLRRPSNTNRDNNYDDIDSDANDDDGDEDDYGTRCSFIRCSLSGLSIESEESAKFF